jgi:Protein of unknown function (DUF3052)
MSAGYSGTPLAKKLGIKPLAKVALVGAPPDFERDLEPIPEGARVSRRLSSPCDVIVFFTTEHADLLGRLAKLAAALDPAGGLWVAWPKKSSGVATDLVFDSVQHAGLALGLVDNKICAVSDIWSGLRFVVRKENRPKGK